MGSVLKGGCIGTIIKWIFIISLSFTIWTMGVVATLFACYGVLCYVTTGADIMGSITYLAEQSPSVIISEFGAKIFGNLPFADFANAVFITHVTPSFENIIQDVVTAALAGLLLFLISRLNLLFSLFIKNRMLFGSITSVMIVLSICLALIGTTYIGVNYTGIQLCLFWGGVLVAALLVHTLFLFFSLGGMKFLRVLLHTVMDLVSGILNNVFLYLCSYVFMYLVPTFNLPTEVVLPYSLLGAFILFGLFSALMDFLTGLVWQRTSGLKVT